MQKCRREKEGANDGWEAAIKITGDSLITIMKKFLSG
jgi:hypothetical protein